MISTAKDLQHHWAALRPLLSVRNEREYDRAMEWLTRLLDEIGTNEQHPLHELLDTLGTLIHGYEEKHHRMPQCSGREMLKFFMEEYHVTQSDLSEIGSQGVVSDIILCVGSEN